MKEWKDNPGLRIKDPPIASLHPAEREQGVTSIFTKYVIRLRGQTQSDAKEREERK